jgi:hypothetical protein
MMGRCSELGLWGGELGDVGLLSAARPESCCPDSLAVFGGTAYKANDDEDEVFGREEL